jgi:hypothetical protein
MMMTKKTAALMIFFAFLGGYPALSQSRENVVGVDRYKLSMSEETLRQIIHVVEEVPNEDGLWLYTSDSVIIDSSKYNVNFLLKDRKLYTIRAC